jgi:activator of HSP90 ATPase
MLAASKHAIERLAQRSFLANDVELIVQFGTDVDDGIMVRSKDVQEVERLLSAFRDRIRRLEGKRLVISEGSLVTAYRPGQKKAKRLLMRP